ncbi:MAG TPA: hypothetical protein EYP36_12260 [Calditrichaeota bacterium]|nr:hypothetical protein [Calditrichota bacterium]
MTKPISGFISLYNLFPILVSATRHFEYSGGEYCWPAMQMGLFFTGVLPEAALRCKLAVEPGRNAIVLELIFIVCVCQAKLNTKEEVWSKTKKMLRIK